jgi:D-glycero-D-manno-heptose 1,7-bisphosphate phosphatase
VTDGAPCAGRPPAHIEQYDAVTVHAVVDSQCLGQLVLAATIHATDIALRGGADVVRPAVFLDRDGVLNKPVRTHDGERPPWRLDEIELTEEAVSAASALRSRGFTLVVVTNQPDVGHGRLSDADARVITDTIADALGISASYMCPHTSADACPCRKPRPGLLLDAAHDFGLDLSASWMVGDRWVDVAAGAAAGVHTILVERPTSWLPTSSGRPPESLRPTAVARGIGDAAGAILASLP